MAVMNREGYKRLGEYIEPVDERNSSLSVKLSQGICNNKYFITPRQVAENSANDKIVRKGQFAYNRATTRNGDKISIAYREGEDCTVSSAYQVFRITDENKLNPHYLWMWFRRPEFDRYARFKSRGSAHEFFEWDEMCEVYLPIPELDVQKRIVSEYQAVEERILANNRFIEELEDTVRILYKKNFIDGIDNNDLPAGWRIGTVQDLATIKYGKEHKDIPDGNIPIIGSGGIMRYGSEILCDKPSVLIPRKGSLNNIMYVDDPFWVVDTMFYTLLKEPYYAFYLHQKLSCIDFLAIDTGSAVPSMTSDTLYRIEALIPDEITLRAFDRQCAIVYSAIKNYQRENAVLKEMLMNLVQRISIIV